MKLGLFTATYLDESLESVFKKAANHGYEAVEIPAFKNGNTHLDVDSLIGNNSAGDIRKLAEKYGLNDFRFEQPY